MVRVYASAIAGLSQLKLSDEIISAHQEQVATRILHVFNDLILPKMTPWKTFLIMKTYTTSNVVQNSVSCTRRLFVKLGSVQFFSQLVQSTARNRSGVPSKTSGKCLSLLSSTNSMRLRFCFTFLSLKLRDLRVCSKIKIFEILLNHGIR